MVREEPPARRTPRWRPRVGTLDRCPSNENVVDAVPEASESPLRLCDVVQRAGAVGLDVEVPDDDEHVVRSGEPVGEDDRAVELRIGESLVRSEGGGVEV